MWRTSNSRTGDSTIGGAIGCKPIGWWFESSSSECFWHFPSNMQCQAEFHFISFHFIWFELSRVESSRVKSSQVKSVSYCEHELAFALFHLILAQLSSAQLSASFFAVFLLTQTDDDNELIASTIAKAKNARFDWRAFGCRRFEWIESDVEQLVSSWDSCSQSWRFESAHRSCLFKCCP